MPAGWPSPTATWGSDYGTTGTTAYVYYSGNSASNVTYLPTPVSGPETRLFKKGKAFKFESSLEFRQWFGSPRAPKKAVKARHGFQQMSRIPCYRGVRTR